MKEERTQINIRLKGMNAIKIAVIYLLIGLVWIIFSDQLILAVSNDAAFLSLIQTTKGWFFVFITSIILYYLINKSTQHLISEHNLMNQIVETVPVGIVFVNKEGQITFANKNAESVLGLTKNKITSRTYNDPKWKITSLDGSPFPTDQLPFSIVQREGKTVSNIEHAIEYSSGKKTLLSINAAPINDKKNNFDGMISAIEDITERKQAEDALYESEEKFIAIFKAAPGSMILSSLPDGKTVEVNNNFSLLTGYSREEALGKTTGDLNMWADPSERDRFLSILQSDGVVQNFEADLNHKSGIIRNGLLSGHILTIHDKKYLLGTFYDITERKKAEEEILKLNRVYAVISQINQAIVHLRDKNTLLKEACRIGVEFGKFQMAWIGLVDEKTKLVNPITFAGVEDGYLTKIKKISVSDIPEGRGPTGTATREGKHFVCNDIENDPLMATWKDEALKRGYRSSIALPIKLFGKVIGAFSLYSSLPHFYEQEEINLLDEVTNDISFALDALEIESSRKKIESALFASETRYRDLFKNHPHPMWIYEVDSLKIIEVNEAAIKNYGYTKNEFESLTLKDIRPAEDIPKLLSNVKTSDESIQRDRTFRHKKKDGTIIHVEISSHNLPSLEDKNYRIVMAIDITEQFEAEVKLLRSEERFRTAFEFSASGMCLTSLTGKFLQVNQALCQMLGYSSEELLNTTFSQITHPDDISLSFGFVDNAINEKDKTLHFEKRYLKKNGDVIWAEISSSLLRDANKKPLYFITQIIDITERKRVEEMLRESEERLRLSTELANVAVWEYDFNTNSMSRSKNHDNLYGLDWQSKWEFETFLNATHPDDREYSNEIIQKSAAAGGADNYKFDFRVVYPNQSIHWLEVTGQVVHRNLEGQGIIVRGCLIDITERKKAEETRIESEEKFSKAFNSSPSALILTRLVDGLFLEANNTYCTLVGYEKSELIGHLTTEFNIFINPSDRQMIIQQLLTKKSVSNFETSIRIKSGEIRQVIASQELIIINGEQCILTSIVDFTERRKVENELVASESKYRSFFENSMDAILLTEPTGEILSANPAACEMFGRTEEEIISIGRTGVVDVSDPRLPILLNERSEKGKASGEITMLRKDGTKFPAELSSALFIDTEGKVRTSMILRDITERKEAEEKLRVSEEKFHSAFHTSPVGITINKISDGKFIEVNDSFLKIFDFNREEVIGRTSLELNMMTQDERKKLIKQQIETGGLQNFELIFQTKSGRPIHTLFSSRPIEIEGERCHVTSIIDITEKKKAEDALKASEEKFAKAFQSSPDIIVLTSLSDGRIVDVNEALQKATGYSVEEVIGKTSTEMQFWANTKDREKYTELLQKEGRVRDLEVGFRIKSGEVRDTLLSGEIIQLDDGKYILGIIRDITDRKKAEEELLKSRDQLRLLSSHLQTIREEERTILAREMHDEVGQILTSIKMNLSLMKRGIKPRDKKIESKEILNEVQSMSRLVDRAVLTVRKMITELRPELLDKLGLISALEWYLEEYETSTKIKCKLKNDFEELILNKEIELTIFRIVQEALTNVAKHSKAKHVFVTIKKIKDSLVTEITDDGIGITEIELKGEKSFGLLGMRERANLVGGKLEIMRADGKGTTVKLVIGA